ncbi:S-layer homology domain-containing protein [Paenibacillus sp. 1P03SA]|uniref:S-layer homology domain-containing protein n=1 Tax=Paenibacillus sp. 1P03SA TaxID=3132294 RepID=UPI0039A29E15
MRHLHKLLSLMMIVCLLQISPLVHAETVLQNQAVNGGTINQNIVFIDVNNHWANDAIYDMAKKGIISGYEDSSFQPEKSITREEFAKLIALTFSINLQTPAEPTFADLNPDKWSFGYVESTKEFLTGYYPPKGKPFFSPDTKATREDVAVALVKTMGYTTDDLQSSSTLGRNFSDVDEISYNLRDYVAIATEKQLIGGYEDRTFRPQKPITRAEVATLLFRVIKSSAQDQTDGPSLEVSVPEKTESGTFYVSGKTHRDAKVQINEKAVSTDGGSFKEGYRLEKEGTYEIRVTAKLPSGKTTTVTKKVTYQVNGPELKVDNTPDTVTKGYLTISGKVKKDAGYSYPTVYLNDEKMYVSSWDGTFSKEVKLTEGENTFTVKAENEAGKETVVTKKVTFSSGGPELKVSSIPDSTQVASIRVSGTVKDANDSYPVLYINDKKVYMYGGSFSESVTLEEGENTLTFKAENANGKVTVVTKKVTFNVNGPTLKLNAVPEKTASKTLTVSGYVTDKNDSIPTFRINGKKVYYTSYASGAFSEEIALSEGENTLVFEATNSAGRSTTLTRTVTLEAGAPVIRVNYHPGSTTLSYMTISGNVTDKNDSYPVVYLNDRKIYTSSYDGTFSEWFDLKKGANPYTIVVSNKYGKTATVTGNVYRVDR